MTRKTKADAGRTNWYVDLLMTVVFLVVLAPTLTGLPIHEWLALSSTLVVIVHLLLHWDWIVTTISRFFGQINPLARLNLIVNTVLLITITVVVLSGLLISETVVKAIGLTSTGSSSWRGIHSTSASIVLILFAVHVALQWKWVAHALDQYLFTPLGWKRS